MLNGRLQSDFASDDTPFARKLSNLAPLDESSRMRLADALGQPVALPYRAELASDRRRRFTIPVVVLKGFIAPVRLLADGRRQIMRLTLPGDIIHPADTVPLSRDSIVALSEAVVAPLDVEALTDDTAIAAALQRASALARLELLNQITRLGRQSAIERTAHLLLELHDRHRLAGLTVRGRFDLSLTQETLSDVLGLTPVHLNRTVQQLRREGLIEMNRHEVYIPDPARLADIADYSATAYSG